MILESIKMRGGGLKEQSEEVSDLKCELAVQISAAHRVFESFAHVTVTGFSVDLTLIFTGQFMIPFP